MPVPRNMGRVFAYARSAGRIEEHDLVRLRGSFHTADGEFMEGAGGTVVGIWADQELYEVEFTRPVQAVVTVPAAALAPLDREP